MGPLRSLVSILILGAALNGCSRAADHNPPRTEYDPATGRLRRLEYDSTGNGRHDAVSIMDGARLLRIELDLDENGKVDRWDFYGPDRQLQMVGFSSGNDGIMDSKAFYAADGSLLRIELSTRRDGHFNRVEFYASGVLVRSEEDTNFDGRPDKWETYRPNRNPSAGDPPYTIESVAFDDTGRGTPQRRFFYGPRGDVIRVEIDPDGDGRFVTQ